MEIITKKSSFFIIIIYIRRAPRPGKPIDFITLIYHFFHTTTSPTYYSALQGYRPILQRLYLLRYTIVYWYFSNLITLTLPYYLLSILLYSSVYQLHLSPRFLQLLQPLSRLKPLGLLAAVGPNTSFNSPLIITLLNLSSLFEVLLIALRILVILFKSSLIILITILF